MELKKAKSKKETSQRLEEEKKRKVFIKNIDPSMTKSKLYSFNFLLEMLKNYFIQFGAIEFVKIVREKKKNGKGNNYGFVMFKQQISLDALLEAGEFHKISRFELQCLRLLTRDELKKKKLEE